MGFRQRMHAVAFVLVAFLGWAGATGAAAACAYPQIRLAEMERRDAHNSVSRCLIEIDPTAPYTTAILAQELWEWNFKRQTGRSIGLAEEIRSHEREVQTAAALWKSVNERDYRIREAHEMHAYYGFDDAGWTHRQIVHAMRADKDAAKADVERMMPVLLDFRARLLAWRGLE